MKIKSIEVFERTCLVLVQNISLKILDTIRINHYIKIIFIELF